MKRCPLGLGDVLNEIYISKEKDIVPLSAVKDSIINEARTILEKEELRWYVKREGEGEGDGIK